VLLSFLNIRAVINGKEIYSLPANKPVMITVMQNNPKVVITDGYHVTKPVELVYHHLHTYYFKVICVIDNTQLLAGSFLLILLYLIGFFTGIFVITMASIFPILYFLFFYYINRKDFLQITPV
jgi:cobalamin biosynthesis protein CobD/CbiB